MDNSANTLTQLSIRLHCNALSSRDLSPFLLRIMTPSAGDVALDIGCGSGKQLLDIAGRVRAVTGIDLSGELIEAARMSVVHQPNVRLLVGDMDHLGGLGLQTEFTLAYSVYSLYYSGNIGRLVREVRSLLKDDGGRFCVVAPDNGNNAQWFEDLQQIFDLPESILNSPRISREQILPALLTSFPEVHCYRFENEVVFQTLDDLMHYYDGCTSYCRQNRRAEARAYFQRLLPAGETYTIRKIALGMLAKTTLLLDPSNQASAGLDRFHHDQA